MFQENIFTSPDANRNNSYYVWNSIELYAGILAVALPTLRPLFRRFLETNHDLQTRAAGSSAARMGTRHRYFVQPEGAEMKGLQAQSEQNGQEYAVKITSVIARESINDYESTMKSRGDTHNSSEGILPSQNDVPHTTYHSAGIVKTMDVTVTSEQ